MRNPTYPDKSIRQAGASPLDNALARLGDNMAANPKQFDADAAPVSAGDIAVNVLRSKRPNKIEQALFDAADDAAILAAVVGGLVSKPLEVDAATIIEWLRVELGAERGGDDKPPAVAALDEGNARLQAVFQNDAAVWSWVSNDGQHEFCIARSGVDMGTLSWQSCIARSGVDMGTLSWQSSEPIPAAVKVLMTRQAEWAAVPEHERAAHPLAPIMQEYNEQWQGMKFQGVNLSDYRLTTMHKRWCDMAESARPLHPLEPLVEAWLHRPQNVARSTVTATQSLAPMTRCPQEMSTVLRTGWADSVGNVSATIVDGEPFTSRLPDLSVAGAFPLADKPARRTILQPATNDQGELLAPPSPAGVYPVPPDLRMSALQGWITKPGLAGDTIQLLTWAYSLDRPMVLTREQGAELLARDRQGGHRRPKKTDIKRFDNASRLCRELHICQGSDWRELVDIRHTRAGEIVIGPALWMRGRRAIRWTLSAAGSYAAKARTIAGEKSLAGRIVTGLEYRLGARFDGQRGIAPDLRPADGKAGAGEPVFVSWSECLAHAGDWHDATNPQSKRAALERFNRAVDMLKVQGYFVPSSRLGAAALAGDTVEIIDKARAKPGQPAGLMVRSSARYVEAAAQANRSQGDGFGIFGLGEWVGLHK